jgi:hypothetical protein
MPRIVRSSAGVRIGLGETVFIVTPVLGNSRARLLAIASPMPLELPVTSARFPSSRRFMSSFPQERVA